MIYVFEGEIIFIAFQKPSSTDGVEDAFISKASISWP